MILYNNVKEGVFLSRPNRFIANILVDGAETVCHVKNTGRCRELLTEGTRVILEKGANPNRKTEYDVVAVYKNDEIINIDSQAPNKVFGEWAANSGYFGKLKFIKSEYTYKKSRFDFYMETETEKIFAEVKGCTLKEDGIALFPDAPTERGVKHINELIDASQNGYSTYIFFIAQMDGFDYFTPNKITHPEFANALKAAAECGVKVKCVSCNVFENGFSVKEFKEIRF